MGHKVIKWELVAMVAVIMITSYHVSQYMAAKDAWIVAVVQGVVLGFSNFLMAHNIFKTGSTSKLPSFVGLVFFALVSAGMQYIYFVRADGIGSATFFGVNLEALVLGIWAPTAEIILGWVYAANTQSDHVASVQGNSAGGRLMNALVAKAEQSLSVQAPIPVPVHVNAVAVNTEQPESEQAKREQLASAAVGVPEIHIPFNPDEVDVEHKRAYVHELMAAGREFNRSHMAKALGIGRTTLYNWTKELEKGAAVA